MKEKVVINLPYAILNKELDDIVLTPKIKEDYLKHVVDSRTAEEQEIQLTYKEKLDKIKTVNVNEKVELNLNKIELLNRIQNELKELKAFILSFKLSNTEFNDYYQIYCRFEELSLLYSYLKEDVEKGKKR